MGRFILLLILHSWWPFPVPGQVSAARTLCCCCWHTFEAALMIRSDAASFRCCGSHPHAASYHDSPFPIKVPIFKLKRKGYIGIWSPWPLHSFAASPCLTASQPKPLISGLNIGSISRPDGTEKCINLTILSKKDTFSSLSVQLPTYT